jgi:hypothetical protein
MLEMYWLVRVLYRQMLICKSGCIYDCKIKAISVPKKAFQRASDDII